MIKWLASDFQSCRTMHELREQNCPARRRKFGAAQKGALPTTSRKNPKTTRKVIIVCDDMGAHRISVDKASQKRHDS